MNKTYSFTAHDNLFDWTYSKTSSGPDYILWYLDDYPKSISFADIILFPKLASGEFEARIHGHSPMNVEPSRAVFTTLEEAQQFVINFVESQVKQ